MPKKRKILLASTVALAVTLAGCSSSNSSSSSTTSASSGGGATKTITIGVIADLTGPAASGNKTAPQGVQAGTAYAKRNGITVKYVVADTATNPTSALSAAQQLVQQDHVSAVVCVSSIAFLFSNFLTQQGIPVIGAAEDGPEWITSKNMFSVYGPIDSTKVSTTVGSFMKSQGVTNLGALGYSISPISAEAAESAAASVEAAGLKAGYLNASFPFGSTNVQPVALAMKSAGIDALVPTTDPNTAFSLVTALRQLGVNLKVALLATGYGGDLQQAGPGALEAAQNVYFSSTFEPIEMNTAATQQIKNDMKSIGVTTDPTYAEYVGYAAVAMLVQALKSAPANPTPSQLVDALGGIKSFNAAGLYGTHSIDMSNRAGEAIGVDNCLWITKLSGSKFDLVPGADPICGSIIPGKTVAPASS